MKKFSCAEYNRKLKNDAIDNLKAVDYDVDGNRLYKVSLNEKVRYNRNTGETNQDKFYFQNYSLTAESLEEKLAFGHPIAFCHLKTFENSSYCICKPSNWMQSDIYILEVAGSMTIEAALNHPFTKQFGLFIQTSSAGPNRFRIIFDLGFTFGNTNNSNSFADILKQTYISGIHNFRGADLYNINDSYDFLTYVYYQPEATTIYNLVAGTVTNYINGVAIPEVVTDPDYFIYADFLEYIVIYLKLINGIEFNAMLNFDKLTGSVKLENHIEQVKENGILKTRSFEETNLLLEANYSDIKQIFINHFN